MVNVAPVLIVISCTNTLVVITACLTALAGIITSVVQPKPDAQGVEIQFESKAKLLSIVPAQINALFVLMFPVSTAQTVNLPAMSLSPVIRTNKVSAMH